MSIRKLRIGSPVLLIRSTLALIAAIAVGAVDAEQSLPEDPAFDEYVSMQTVGDAIYDFVAARLAESAEKLAEAENKLDRKHSCGLTARALFEIALKAAAESRDAETLQRVTTWALQNGANDLVQLAELSRRLAGPSRALDPAFLVDVESYSLDAFLFSRMTLEQLSYAKTIGDPASLDAIAEDIAATEIVTPAQRESLLRATENARQAMADSQKNEILRRLASASRGSPKPRKRAARTPSASRAPPNPVAAQAQLTQAQAGMIKAIGERRVSEAKVAQTLEQVYSMKLDNKEKRIQLNQSLKKQRAKYWQERRANVVRYLEKKKTRRYLRDARWPSLFDQPQYSAAKRSLQALLLLRTPANSGRNSVNYEQVAAEIQDLNALIEHNKRELSTSARVALMSFLRNVQLEAARPMLADQTADPIYQLARSQGDPAPTNEMLASLDKLTAHSRSLDTSGSVSVLSVHPESYALHRAFLSGIASAVVFEDDEALAGLKHAARRAPLLEDAQREHILRKIDAKDSGGTDTLIPDALSGVGDALARIAGLEEPLLRGSSGLDDETRQKAFESLVYLYAAA